MSKAEIVVILLRVFRQHGYEGASLAKISAATGLGKASLYHHFPGGKEEMAQAVLAHLANWREATIFAPLRAGGTPLERLQAMTTALKTAYAEGRQPCMLSILTVGESKDVFSTQIQAAFTTLIGAIAAVLREGGLDEISAQQRAEDAILQIQGSLVLSRGLDRNDPFLRVMSRLPEQLLAMHARDC